MEQEAAALPVLYIKKENAESFCAPAPSELVHGRSWNEMNGVASLLGESRVSPPVAPFPVKLSPAAPALNARSKTALLLMLALNHGRGQVAALCATARVIGIDPVGSRDPTSRGHGAAGTRRHTRSAPAKPSSMAERDRRRPMRPASMTTNC